MMKITSMCFSVKTSNYLLKRTQKSSLHHFSTKLTCAEQVNTRALFAGYFRGQGPFKCNMPTGTHMLFKKNIADTWQSD